jgi:hypothetical protein
MRARLPDLVAGLVTLAFGLACALFVWQPALATFADDSVSYLVMAQVFSPWQAASPAVAAAFAREAIYPPLFPLLLALAGAAHDFAWAHGLIALLLAAALPVAYWLGARWLGSRGAAAAAVACVALLPTMWVNAKGVLSEPLFCLLLMSTFLALERGEGDDSRQRAWRLGLLAAGLALTRTAALPMLGVLALWLAARPVPAVPAQPVFAWRARLGRAAPALAALAAYSLWVLLRPAHTGEDYGQILSDKGAQFLGGPGGLAGSIAASVARQANAILEGWAGSLMIYWIEGRPARFVLASLVGALSLAGLALRLRRNRADAWMAAAYLATLLGWPFHEQMERFLFPLVPALVLYAFQAAGEGMAALQRPGTVGHALLAALVLSLCLPAMAFLAQRAKAPGPHKAITDWYRQPDLARARARAQTHLDLMDDLREVRQLTRPDERVMWVVPGYVALLADRQGVAAPDPALGPEAYREAVRKSGADYVFLSRYHPRDTIRDTAWRAGLAAFGDAKPLYTGAHAGGTVVTSLLLKAPK